MPEILATLQKQAQAEHMSPARLLMEWQIQSNVDLMALILNAVWYAGQHKLTVNLEEVRRRTLIAFSGLLTKPSTMMPLLASLRDTCGCEVHAYPKRMHLSEQRRWDAISWGSKQIEKAQKQGRRVAILGWSAGGNVAKFLGDQLEKPWLAILTPRNSNVTPIGRILRALGHKEYPILTLSPHGHVIRDGFSLTGAGSEWTESPDRVTSLPGPYGHLAINRAVTRFHASRIINDMFERS